jgi:YHS domain-containing protein
MQIGFSDAAGRGIYKGRFIYFCNSACKEKFDADPEKYLKSGAHDVEKKLPVSNSGDRKSEDGAIFRIGDELCQLRGQDREGAVEDERHLGGQGQFYLGEGQRDLRSIAG